MLLYALISVGKLQDIKIELNLIEGCTYEVLQNGGKVIKDLVFQKIYYGNRSANGNINLAFTKRTLYRGTNIEKEVIIKYGSIWKITKTD